MEPSWLSVKVHPNARRDALVSLGPGRFEAWVRAKPVQGDANEAVIRLLATNLQMRAEQIRLMKGRVGRHKVFKVNV